MPTVCFDWWDGVNVFFEAVNPVYEYPLTLSRIQHAAPTDQASRDYTVQGRLVRVRLLNGCLTFQAAQSHAVSSVHTPGGKRSIDRRLPGPQKPPEIETLLLPLSRLRIRAFSNSSLLLIDEEKRTSPSVREFAYSNTPPLSRPSCMHLACHLRPPGCSLS